LIQAKDSKTLRRFSEIMFCPSCGLEDTHRNQFCRACGADLHSVRTALEKPDSITSSAVSARDEIGRAIAAKILQTQSAGELKTVAKDVLPEIEKFLESPEEKRMRRLRDGMIVACVGLGAAIGFLTASTLMGDRGVFFFVGLGIVTFFIGISFVINALLFTIPKKSIPDKSIEAKSQRELDGGKIETNDLVLPESNDVFSSVTEHTTQQLKKKQPIPRQ
jgi:hypothetical protein